MNVVGHYMTVCNTHGTLYEQCRCPAADKTVREVPCRPKLCQAKVGSFSDWLVAAVVEYGKLWDENYAAKSKPQRWGQFLFNKLEEARSDLGAQIAGKVGLDPFHDDDNVEAFFAYVGEHW